MGTRVVVHRVALGVGLALVFGCGAPEIQKTYDNRRALESRVERPVAGSAWDRTYRNTRFLEATFTQVRVEEPRVRGESGGDRDLEEFLRGLREALKAGAAEALRGTGRYGQVVTGPAGGEPSGLLCEIEALPHVSPLGHTVRPDPVFRDPRPKLFVVFTLVDEKTREVVLRYTTWGISQWDYSPWAMEDLQGIAFGLAGEFQEVLEAR